MAETRCLPLPLALVALVGCAQAPPASEEFRLPGTKLAVMMPDVPQFQADQSEPPAMNLYSVVQGRIKYQVYFALLEGTFNSEQLPQALDATLEARIAAQSQANQARATGKSEVRVGDLVGREWDYELPDGTACKERLFLVQPHGIFLAVGWDKGQPLPALGQEFLNSLKAVD